MSRPDKIQRLLCDIEHHVAEIYDELEPAPSMIAYTRLLRVGQALKELERAIFLEKEERE